MLEARNLVAGYVPGLPILHGVSLRVAPGEIVCVIGPNGAGKSTLVKAIAGLILVETGSVRLGDRDITGVPTHELAGAGIGYVPQTANVFTTLTVHENLLVAGHRLGSDRAGRIERVYGLFPDLAARRRDRGRVLSGGQRQLLALARALVIEPVAMMLDEATAGLAPRAAADVFARVRELAGQGVAVLGGGRSRTMLGLVGVPAPPPVGGGLGGWADEHGDVSGPALIWRIKDEQLVTDRQISIEEMQALFKQIDG